MISINFLYYLQPRNSSDKVGDVINLSTPLMGDTKYQRRKGYLAELRRNQSQIRDRTKNTKNWKRINRKTDTDFTYGNLKQMLEEVTNMEYSAFEINLGFGAVLFHPVEKVYLYFYVSNNHFL